MKPVNNSKTSIIGGREGRITIISVILKDQPGGKASMMTIALSRRSKSGSKSTIFDMDLIKRNKS